MTATILSLSIAYALLAVVAVFLALNSRLALILRGGLTVFVVILILLTYRGISDIRGLPSDAAPPERFRLYWAQILEPNKLTRHPGSIFLWIGELDEDYFPISQPRAHKLPYSLELAELVLEAQRAVAKGEDIAGEVTDELTDEATADELADEADDEDENNSDVRVGERYLNFDFGNLTFGNTPSPVTPDKDN